jgi:hypothetical protein
MMSKSIFIVFFLVGSLNANADVLGLILGKDCQVSSKSLEMKTGNFLIQNLRKLVDSNLVLLIAFVGPELELGKSLVGERG